MSDSNNSIYNALGLDSSKIVAYDPIKQIVAEAHNDSAKNDFEMARANVHEIIQNNSVAMERLLDIANASQHPRAYEVLAKMMDTQLNANQKLLDLQKQIREIEAADVPNNDNARTINNNLFVGSTAELQKMIESMKNGSDDSQGV